jgi:hypothetical protein
MRNVSDLLRKRVFFFFKILKPANTIQADLRLYKHIPGLLSYFSTPGSNFSSLLEGSYSGYYIS